MGSTVGNFLIKTRTITVVIVNRISYKGLIIKMSNQDSMTKSLSYYRFNQNKPSRA